LVIVELYFILVLFIGAMHLTSDKVLMVL